MANAPLSGRDGKSCSLICISEKQKYFFGRGWTKKKLEGPEICPSGAKRACKIGGANEAGRGQSR
jgi:hypothetical protein